MKLNFTLCTKTTAAFRQNDGAHIMRPAIFIQPYNNIINASPPTLQRAARGF